MPARMMKDKIAGGGSMAAEIRAITKLPGAYATINGLKTYYLTAGTGHSVVAGFLVGDQTQGSRS
jgi:hypothetical protein